MNTAMKDSEDKMAARNHKYRFNFCRTELERVLAVVVLLGSLAQTNVFANTKLAHPIPDSQNIFLNNNNLSAEVFFAAYNSQNVTERRYAQMYLLGVVDAIEGVSFCGYSVLKTLSINEVVYTGFKRLQPAQLTKRASTVIREILSENTSCKSDKK